MVLNSRTNEMILFVVPRNSHIKYNLGIPFQLGFHDVDAVSGHPLSKVLKEMAGIPSGIIAGIEAEAGRIGLFDSGLHSK
jgi:hypothetical protein